MKPAHEIANQVLTQQPQSQTPQAQQTRTYRSELPAGYIEKFFARMSSIYGHKFNSLFRDSSAYEIGQQEWASAIAPLSDKQIKRGLEACRYLNEWNPNIPEFVRIACDLPSVDQCISRVIAGKNIDPVSYRIAWQLGSMARQMFSVKELTRMIRSHYEDSYAQTLSERMGNDEEFTPAAALPKQEKPEPVPATPEQAEAAIKSMMSVVNG